MRLHTNITSLYWSVYYTYPVNHSQNSDLSNEKIDCLRVCYAMWRSKKLYLLSDLYFKRQRLPSCPGIVLALCNKFAKID